MRSLVVCLVFGSCLTAHAQSGGEESGGGDTQAPGSAEGHGSQPVTMLQYLELREEYSEFYNYVNAASPAALLTIEAMSGGTAFLPDNAAMLCDAVIELPDIEDQASVDAFVLRHFVTDAAFTVAQLESIITGNTAGSEAIRLGQNSAFNVNTSLIRSSDATSWAGGIVHRIDEPFLTLLGANDGTFAFQGGPQTVWGTVASPVPTRTVKVAAAAVGPGKATTTLKVKFFISSGQSEPIVRTVTPGSSTTLEGAIESVTVEANNGSGSCRGTYDIGTTPGS